MSNEVLPFISNEVADLFAQFDDDILADVLRLWDCDAQDWADGTTAVFRFENDDLLVWSVKGELKAVLGAVNTQSFCLGSLLDIADDQCISWRPDPSFADQIGRAARSATLLESFV